VLGSVRHSVVIERTADVVWPFVGEAARLHEWFPGIVSSPVDGTTRVITMATGLSMPEEILVNDPLQRRFQYRITAPVFQHHRGTVDVIALEPGRCVVVYATDADPRTMALMIGAGTAGALAELKRRTEARAAG
jgi:hypothetical protein